MLNMSALERIMLSMARCGFRKHGIMIVTSGNVKTLKKHWKHVYKRQVVVVEVNIFLYIIIVVTPSAPPPLPLQWEHQFLIFIALTAARARLPNEPFTTTKFCLPPIALLSLQNKWFSRRSARNITFFKRILTILT